MYSNRLDRVNQELQSRELDCLVLVPGANLVYLTGLSLHLGDRPTCLILRPNRAPALILPALEVSKAAGLIGWELFAWTDEESFGGAFRAAGAQLGLAGSRIGVEAFTMRVIEARLIEASAPGCQLVPADGVVTVLRQQKGIDELDCMHRAVELAQQALRDTLARFRLGMTERELDAALRIALLSAGGEAVSFAPIVSAGPNSANPHARPTDRPVQDGDFLLFDWGVYVGGYASDITRTFPVGTMDEEMRRIYDLVKEANQAGREACRPGATCDQVDAAARGVIRDGGYGDHFTHRTGHGLGLQIHEPPFIVAGNHTVLEPGMTFTIEPGIYLPGRGGVRIEDDVVVTEAGAESLTTMSRDWTPIG